jgi:nucleoside-diphosphate-sugar epimerase
VPVVLVLGANGFIGSHVVDALGRRPGLDVVGAGIGRPLAGLERGWIDVDLLEADASRLVAELRAAEPAVLVNCAGATAGSTADLVRLNVLTTARVLEALGDSALPARLVHLGSAAEYGPGPAGRAVVESTCPAPSSPYGIAKLAASRLVLAAAARGRDAVVMRVFNALGPDMPENSLPGVAMRRIREALAGSRSRIEFGSLDSVRDFVDVRDIGAAVAAACLAPRLEASLLNVGSGTGHTARELVAGLAEGAGYHGEIGEGATGSSRSGDVPWQVADVSLARQVLGWEPVHDLRSSIELMIGEG